MNGIRPIIDNSLILILDPMNPKSYIGGSSTWVDLSLYNNDTTLNGTCVTETNNLNNIVGIEMGTNDYGNFTSNDFIFGTSDFTLDFWIYPKSFAGYTHFISIPTQNTFALKADIASGAVYFYSPTWNIYPCGTLSLNSWNNVIFKRESSVGHGYLNGILMNSGINFTNNFTSNTINIHNGAGDEYNLCSMGVIKIYNRSLTNNEISINYNSMRNRYNI